MRYLAILVLLLAPLGAEEITIGNGTKTVTAAGTAERLVAARGTHATTLIVQCDVSASACYVGDSTTASTTTVRLEPGEKRYFARLSPGDYYELFKIWVDVGTNGNKVLYSYVLSPQN